MSGSIERDIIEQATRSWVKHRRHALAPLPGGRGPLNEDLGLNLYWQGDRWYATVVRWPARTPGRRIGATASSANSALTNLLAKLRSEG